MSVVIGHIGKPEYTFCKSWTDPGGPLHGNNFVMDLCNGRTNCTSVQNANIYNFNGIWLLPNAPVDVIFYLWKIGRGDNPSIYITEDQILYLYIFADRHSFPLLRACVHTACNRIYTTCILT
jgi:hypothetical protein